MYVTSKRTFRVAVGQIKIHAADRLQIQMYGAETALARCAVYILKYELA